MSGISLLKTYCYMCGPEDSPRELHNCLGCHVVKYCGSRHQNYDRSQHNHFCTPVAHARRNLDDKERILLTSPHDRAGKSGQALFDEDVGMFGVIDKTYPYMEARKAFIKTLLKIHTPTSLRKALVHINDMLRLDHFDNFGVRHMAPALYLRLGDDISCYKFIQYWESIESENAFTIQLRSRWIDPRTEDENIFQEPELYLAETGFVFQVTAMLLKIRLLIDLKSLQALAMATRRAEVPQEILDIVQDMTLAFKLKQGRVLNFQTEIKKLKMQIKELYRRADIAHACFWPSILNSGIIPGSMRGANQGVLVELQKKLDYTWPSWNETRGAPNIVRQIKESFESYYIR